MDLIAIDDCFHVSYFLQLRALNAGVAQLVERLTCNEDVVGSTPISGSSFSDYTALV